ncbi:enantio-pyochelin biosynthetic protein PchC [Streptomyces himastatinicus ATCC 53653]|uniref:Enantio-pyochelin biosynthetic protein PchC n=1 Tax=Streptomyces himastatinicus ATCC 53653 TaxID=457427 RepID=D9W616_9ACTN|nr:alpha/beta fold hydrolase [Streptomyces himastatinicus]EFL20372.1 enantio-pyochelin biosynthetic protein PchC [Streptomyces himastatinicus ATCC 53653]
MTQHAPFPTVELKRLTDRQTARIRLYCVPPSGTGSEFYLPWVAAFSELFDLVSVDLPGRGTRAGEPSITDIGWAATGIAEAIAADLRHRPPADGFYAVFGHSFGALLAFEATQRLRSASPTAPDLLALSALPPPDRDGLDAHIARNLGSGIAAITETMGWEQPTDDTLTRTVYTPFLADAVALLQHTRQPWPPLGAPLSVFGGLDDPMVDPESLHEWSICTTADTRVHRFPGGHHYLRTQVAEVVAGLTDDLLAAYRRPAGGK